MTSYKPADQDPFWFLSLFCWNLTEQCPKKDGVLFMYLAMFYRACFTSLEDWPLSFL